MSYPFAFAFRDEIAQRCAAFPRVACEALGLKRAAVAITLVDADDGSGETAFLLTKRVPRMRAHAGQWALPGGRCDPGETLEETAFRELQEELGLTLGADNLLGVLDDYPTRSGYAITPVVAWLDDASAMSPNPDEVAFVRRIRLDHIGQEDAVEFETIPESERPVIRLRMGDRHVHAPTAALVYQLRELAAGRITRVDQLEQPVFAWR
ncbi:MAG TPA: CoA pyrophosphatase [Caulobacteraceae bacterium]|jgi:8-oxo-dGTP pyrophosphatase MutT (NUDIX family)